MKVTEWRREEVTKFSLRRHSGTSSLSPSRHTAGTSSLSVEHAPTRCLSRGGGFTLVEVVAVMVIMTILAVSVAASLDSVSDIRATAAARHALSDLTYARQRAASTGVTCWVVFDDGWSVLLEDADNPGRAHAMIAMDFATGGPHKVVPGELYNTALLSASFDDRARIGFNWLGKPLVDDNTPLITAGTITFSGGRVVTVQPETGYAAYQTK